MAFKTSWRSHDSLWLSGGLLASGLAVTGLLACRRSCLSQRRRGLGFWVDADDNELKFSEAAATIQQNMRSIQDVLFYWFGQDRPDVNQKHLWMIQDPKQLMVVDQEIFDKFGFLLLELMQDSNISKWKKWCKDEVMGYRAKIAAIVVLDQFSRHIHRHCLETREGSLETQHLLLHVHDQKIIDQRALATAELFVQCHSKEMETGMIPLPMCIFALMPFRHASKLETVRFVHDQIENRLAPLLNHSDAMIRRFRKATNRRLAVLQDTARRAGGNGTTPGAFTDEDILETLPFEADLSSVKNHAVHSTICKFLGERGIIPNNKRTDEHLESPTVLIVSLSGGVDSMVIAFVLSELVRCHGYDSCLRVVAVHIDYANRPESAAEASFVERWCNQHDIDFYCRRIDEVTRGVTARDEYEAMSRDVRFSFYRNTLQKYRNERSPTTEEDDKGGVVLGHHRGDLRENVLSNAHKGCGPLDLSGMTPVSKNNGVTLLRPLLSLEKDEIFIFAHTFGVPYFKDTTPHWSTRGKLRNKLLPLLQEVYGEGCLNNLSQLAVESDHCRALVHKVLFQPFYDAIEKRPMGIKISTKQFRNNDYFFWKLALREALHSASFGMFSDKSTEAFMERIQTDSPRAGWLQCRKDYAVYLQEDGSVFVLFPKSFPWSKSDKLRMQTDANGLSCPVDDSTVEPLCIGPWQIHVERIEKSAEHNNEWDFLLEEKAFASMDDFMAGSFSYYLQVPSGVGSLVFRTFTKANRPRAWKGIDTKIQDTLPLLGVEDCASKNRQKDSTSFLVKISYHLKSPL
ncbi:hypothetical protein ACA910_018308 [Epithemia clementina (nom. ined.)]